MGIERTSTEEKAEAKEEINRASNRRSSIMNLVGDSMNSLFIR
jgi:hypothetical protein